MTKNQRRIAATAIVVNQFWVRGTSADDTATILYDLGVAWEMVVETANAAMPAGQRAWVHVVAGLMSAQEAADEGR